MNFLVFSFLYPSCFSHLQDYLDPVSIAIEFWVHEYPISFHALQIRYAYELLTNPTWKRNYDMFGIEEQHVSGIS